MQQTNLSPPGECGPEAGNLDDLHYTFIQNVSHELRTPLTIIQGYAELLGDGSLGALAPEQQEAVFVIVSRASELRTLVERIDILLAVEAHETASLLLALDEIVAEVVKGRRAAATQAGLTLEVHLEPDLPPVSGTPQHLQQAIDCLLENALKFTPGGGRVEVQVYTEPGWVCLAVTDTGIGITGKELERILTRFYQRDRSITRRYGGIGLGLTLVRAVIKEHSGQIEVESQPGQGSRFTIKLPTLSPAAQVAQLVEDAMPSQRIPIADDRESRATVVPARAGDREMTKVHALKLGKRAPLRDQSATHSPQRDAFEEITSQLTLPQTDSSPGRRGERIELHRLKPNCARMTDYWLGGYHHLAIDRLVARYLEAILPEAPEIWREQRRFLQRAVAYMVHELGLNQFIDFGSGLPTRGNVHEIVQAINPAAKVIYSDINLACVIQGQDILDGNPNICYVQCDAADPSELLRAPVTSQMLNNDHRVGIGFSGLGHFLPDEALAKSLAILYEWAAEGSCIAVVAISRGVERFPGLKQILLREGMPLFPRSEQEMLKLLGPWQLTEHGIAPGPYWGLPEKTTREKEIIAETSFSFLVYKCRPPPLKELRRPAQ
jgi:two-component sensor histidine kinase